MVREVNISLWEGVTCNGPERKYFACYCKNISLWEGVEVLQAMLRAITGISWHLGLRCDLFLLCDVPSSVRIL